MQLARVVPDIEHCTFEPGDSLVYSLEWTEDTEDVDDATLHIRAGFTRSQELAEKHSVRIPAKSFEELVPELYRKFKKVFDKQASERLPEQGRFSHPIDLKPEFEECVNREPINCKLIPMSATEQAALDAFLKEARERGIIRPSKSPMASPFFFVKKKDGTLRPV